MRGPNWTWGISAGLLFVATVGAIKLFQNPSVRQNPGQAMSDFANGFAKRYRDQMSDPSPDLAASTVASNYSSPAYAPPANLVGAPPSASANVCPICGGDSRYCPHGAHGAIVAAPNSRGTEFKAARLGTSFDQYVDYYFP